MIESNGKTLAELAHGIGAIKVVGNSGVVVRGVRQDSRNVLPGELFAVRGGARTTGWNFVADALSRGAVAVMAEADLSPVPLAVPVVIVRDVRAAIARAAAIVYDDPTRSLDVIGITGTNGKTTTSYLLSRALESCGLRPGIIGTVGYRFEDLVLDAPHTTPESDEIARIARTMRDRGASHLVMEVSSHALAQGRVEAVHFRAAAFTNLTQDHLDFHGDMAAYGAAKARLFLDLSPGASVVNVDDPFGSDLASRIKGPLLRVSSTSGATADVAPTSVSLEPHRTRAALRTPRGNVEIDSGLIGAHNLSNMVVCVGIAAALGLGLDATAAALSEASVPGRLERCDGPGDDLVVVVDYAHTPDALDRVLSALTVLREGTSTRGRLLCVFGCGGDRDPNKRAPMGRAVAKWADIAVVTNDNPRTEDPEAIAKAILPGLEHARAVVVELDRERAIAGAIAGAKPGDVVLIAGKGHETYQIVGNVARHFDDREQARAALARRRAPGGDA
jgi:UDP-N-acetylmuramoyl-L-alanyl-D-glutamate--2,6-diaminopimelate ligase